MNGKPTDFWAKLEENEDGDVVGWHPLFAHSIDVAVTLKTLLQHSILRRRLGNLVREEPLSEVQIDRLAALAALHDVGKVNQGFQDRAFDGAGRTAGHVRPLVDFVKAPPEHKAEILEALNLRPMMDWVEGPRGGEQTLLALLLTTFGHHGRPVIPRMGFDETLWHSEDGRDPVEGISRLRRRVEDWFPAAFAGDAPPFPENPRFEHAYNGVLTLADWVASDRTFFEFHEAGEDRLETAKTYARRAANRVGLNPSPNRESLGAAPPEFAPFPDVETPYEIQRTTHDLRVRSDGSLTILESDTGSGKTEAAIARFLRLYHAGEVDGMYFALPTRSAAKQLHGRVKAAVDRAFDHPPPVVQAVPGYIRVDDSEATRLPDFDVRWDDDPDARERDRRWAAEQSKRYLAGAVAVGTVDQVLLSTLKAEHAHLRGSALLRHLLVVDEVHASDPYMTSLLESAIDQHLAAGGHALLMSATLGGSARERFATGDSTARPSLEESLDTPYPLVTEVGARREDPNRIHASSSDDSKVIRPTPRGDASDPEAVAQRALEAAESGARVLVIRNTVGDCRETQRAVETLAPRDDLLFRIDGTAAPHHSRFAPADRRLLDERVETRFGQGANSTGGVVCTATQTVEQSLDIDADYMITDLCPVDVLLQRIGRLHRHGGRSRPDGFDRTRVDVLVPEERGLGDAIGDGGEAYGDHGYGTVYADLRTLEACWRLVENEQTWEIPEMNRELVEKGTHPERLESIAEEGGDRWQAHQQKIRGVRSAEVWKSEHWMIAYETHFAATENAFPNYAEVEEHVQTRLGDDGFQVDLGRSVAGPFGREIDEVNLPAWMLPDEFEGSDEPEVESVAETNEGFRFRFAGRAVGYTRLGIHCEEV